MVESMHPDMAAHATPDRFALRMADSGEGLRYGGLAADANRIARVLAALTTTRKAIFTSPIAPET